MSVLILGNEGLCWLKLKEFVFYITISRSTRYLPLKTINTKSYTQKKKKSCEAIIYKNKYIYYTHVHSDIIKYRWKSSIRESTKLQIQKFIIQISYIK